MKSYFVYVMTNKTRSTIYIGMTNDLATRVHQHRSGENEGFTKSYRLNRLVYYEVFSNVRDAIARETQLKGWRREKKNWLIAKQNPTWRDLAAELFQPVPCEPRGSSTSLRSAQNDNQESAE